MLEFLKKWFSGNTGPRVRQWRSKDPTLDLGPAVKNVPSHRPEGDVHQLMIEATAIRRELGYPEAIQFLKDLAAVYQKEENTALVTCINKLIRYMVRDPNQSYDETYSYLNDNILKALPLSDPYFLNLHITMAELIESQDKQTAINYLLDFLLQHPPSRETYYHLIKLSDIYGSTGDMAKAHDYLQLAKTFWNPHGPRQTQIRMQRRWFRSAAEIAARQRNKREQSNYLVYRLLEFALDMARVLDPAHIDDFHKRKDQYFNKIRGFEDQDNFEQALDFLNISEKKQDIIRKTYGFVFEEMPIIMGVSKSQLHYHKGSPESIEEVRDKMLYAEKPFTQLPEIETQIRQFINRFL